MNKRTHHFTNFLSLRLYSRKGLCFCCVWDMCGDRDRVLYWPKFLSWPWQHYFRILARGGRWRPQPSISKLVLTLAFLYPTNSTAAGTYLYSFKTSTCFHFYHLFTQVHLLIDGSAKSQYITVWRDLGLNTPGPLVNTLPCRPMSWFSKF